MTIPGRLVLLGHPVSHSLSPRFQQAALDAAGIALRYEAIDVSADALEAMLVSLKSAGAAGNVTIPHKEAVYARCDVRSPVAERVGAVNTFLIDGGKLIGDNTDVGGFDAAARDAFGSLPDGLRVAVLGAGGGAAGVLAAVEGWPNARAVIASRNVARARTLAARFGAVATVVADVQSAVRECDMVVNATPIGLRDDDVPVDPDDLPHGTRVFDLVYRRGETPWVRQARARGLVAADGLGMLIEQGALSFTRWFGVAPDKGAMWKAVS